jgi:DNA-binding transcriptional regulator/RsmH inhibitor MraZ
MLPFRGQERCSVDRNGRVKFSPKTLRGFQDECGCEVVLHCLPEGALAVYPEEVYERMRSNEPRAAERAGESLVFRRTLRRFGALSSTEKISTQGRVTIPQGYRDMLGIGPGQDVVVIGVEIGVEIWNAENWKAELERINTHVTEKGEREMAADLHPAEESGTSG